MGSQYKRGEGVIDSVTVQEVGGQVHNHSNQRGRGSQYKRWTGQEFKVQARGGGRGRNWYSDCARGEGSRGSLTVTRRVRVHSTRGGRGTGLQDAVCSSSCCCFYLVSICILILACCLFLLLSFYQNTHLNETACCGTNKVLLI